MSRMTIRRGDYVILSFAIVMAVVCCIVLWRPRADGKTVVVTTPEGESRYALSANTTFTVEGNDGVRLTIHIDAGRVRVSSSTCPDKVCVNSGWLSKNGQTAACVPAGVSVRVAGDTWDVDGVTA